LGWLAHERGDDQLACQQFQEALVLYEEADNQLGNFWAHLNAGRLYQDLSDFNQSDWHYRQALRFWNLAGSKGLICVRILANFGSLEVHQCQGYPPAEHIEHLCKAALLLGAVEKLRGGFDFFGGAFPYEKYMSDLEFLRSHFTDVRITKAWSEGGSMDFDQAWAYLLKAYN
jgi:hypothetical protein